MKDVSTLFVVLYNCSYENTKVIKILVASRGFVSQDNKFIIVFGLVQSITRN